MAKARISDWIQNNREPFYSLACRIWETPEIAYQEYQAVELQKEVMRQHGFRITQKEGLPTAFMAESGESGPVLALLGEYDALAGLSQKVSAEEEPCEKGAPGHGCGHNLIGVGGMLAACAVKPLFDEMGVQARVRYYGCPAEELLTGKSKMITLGYFDGVDVALTWHPNSYSSVSNADQTALASVKFTFSGRTSHAALYPERGRSASDAVELMNIGANYLREHTVERTRLHYTVPVGKIPPNSVLEDASSWYFLRAADETELCELWRRLVLVAKGAALMTGTEVSSEVMGGCYNTLYNEPLSAVLQDNLFSFALPLEYSYQDELFAENIQESLPRELFFAGLNSLPEQKGETLLAKTPLRSAVKGETIMASTDVGDICHLIPTAMMLSTTWPVGIPHHSWQATACSGSAIGLKGMEQAATTLAGALYDLATDSTGSKIRAAKDAFIQARGGRRYTSIEDLLKGRTI